jgi:hypothetical protein
MSHPFGHSGNLPRHFITGRRESANTFELDARRVFCREVPMAVRLSSLIDIDLSSQLQLPG